MSISVSRESISKLMTELVDTFPIESEGRSSISDFGKLLFTEGQGGTVTKPMAGATADSGSGRTLPPSDEDEHDNENDNENDDDDDDDDDDEEEDEEDEEQSALEDAKIAGCVHVCACTDLDGGMNVWTSERVLTSACVWSERRLA